MNKGYDQAFSFKEMQKAGTWLGVQHCQLLGKYKAKLAKDSPTYLLG